MLLFAAPVASANDLYSGYGRQDQAQGTPRADTLSDLEDQQIPVATITLDESGNIVAANVALAAISLVIGGASLLFLRLRRLNSPRPSGAQSAGSKGVGTAMGTISIGLGAVNAILLVLSQFLVGPVLIPPLNSVLNSTLDATQNSSIPWTPVMLTIGIIQLICSVGLFVSTLRANRQTQKSPRFRIRY
jgi:hypothetical protein